MAAALDLHSYFECPICCEYAIPPIFQCDGGHILCAPCRRRLTQCPSCRSQLGNIRNLALENIANAMLFPCTFTANGCSIQLQPKDKLDHEKTCTFQPKKYKCPHLDGAICKWSGVLPKVMSHIYEVHRPVTQLEGKHVVFQAMEVKLGNSADWVMSQSCYGATFLFMLKKSRKPDGNGNEFSLFGRVIGTGEAAANFQYEVRMKNRRGKLLWKKPVRSMDSLEEGNVVQDSDEVLKFDESFADIFVENRNLRIEVTITQNNVE